MMVLRILLMGGVALGCGLAQEARQGPKPKAPVVKSAVVKSAGEAGEQARAANAEARAAIAEARKLVAASRKVAGPERSRRLELAAAALDRVAAQAVREPAIAALAAWHAGETWRSHGSAPLAERSYLRAAKLDAVRYGQRGLLRAADMQRRQRRAEAAMKTYASAERRDPRTSYAQDARLWIARMLLASGRVDRAIERFQVALESAPSPRYAIETADYLAKAWIVKGDLDAAGFVIDHARQLVLDESDGDPVDAARLRRAFAQMGAPKALQRARDAKAGAKDDAVRLDQYRRQGKPGSSGQARAVKAS